MIRGLVSVALLSLSCHVHSGPIVNLLTNGAFETGDFTGWTSFTTPDGIIGSQQVTDFDVVEGAVSPAAEFTVRKSSSTASAAGGGVFQTVAHTGGDLALSVDVASTIGAGSTTQFSGIYSLIFDGNVIDTVDFPRITGGETLRAQLSGSVLGLAPGNYDFRLQVVRDIDVKSSAQPRLYFDNAAATVMVPLPGTLAILGIGALGLIITCRPRMR